MLYIHLQLVHLKVGSESGSFTKSVFKAVGLEGHLAPVVLQEQRGRRR